MPWVCLGRLVQVMFVLMGAWTTPTYAKKGSAMVYEDPFDLGAGGASLTRASQAGMLIANPALLPYGDGFHRWVGLEPTLLVGRDSMEFAKGMSGGGASDPASIVDTVSKTPIHAGMSNALSYMNRSFGFTVFDRFEPDLTAKKYGSTGLPEINFQAESYHGAAMSFASMLGTRAVSLGVTAKYLYAAEPNAVIELTDQEGIKKLTSQSGLKSMVTHNTGMGADAGLLFFKQGLNFDLKLALKADDIGSTKLQGEGTLEKLPQMYSAGLGATLHNGTDALHLAFDYRDVQAAYGEKEFKRMRAGAKILFRRYVGIGAGMMDGWPTYSLELDLILLRITGAFWMRELGTSPGVSPRPIYAAGIAMGF